MLNRPSPFSSFRVRNQSTHSRPSSSNKSLRYVVTTVASGGRACKQLVSRWVLGGGRLGRAAQDASGGPWRRYRHWGLGTTYKSCNVYYRAKLSRLSDNNLLKKKKKFLFLCCPSFPCHNKFSELLCLSSLNALPYLGQLKNVRNSLSFDLAVLQNK